jgi:2-dehydro-3-deoxygluconokinase
MTRIVAFGEILMRLHAPGNRRLEQARSWETHYSGSEGNVLVLLSRLGHSTSLVTALPNNQIADAALAELRMHRVGTESVLRQGDRIGIYFTESPASVRPGRVHYDRLHSSFSQLQTGQIPWNKVLQGASWFHWSGISAALSASAAEVCGEALNQASKMKLQISADLNYRSTLWNYGKRPSEVMPALIEHVHVLNADFEAAEQCLGVRMERGNEPDLEGFQKQLFGRFPNLQWAAVTFRRENLYSGALFSRAEITRSEALPLGNVVDRIGSGDAFMAGLIDGLIRNSKANQIIGFAVAAGAMKHSIPGDLAIFSRNEVEALMNNPITSGKVIR